MSEPETTPAAAPRPRINRRALRTLREPIPAHNVAKKPRVYCWACNQAAEARPGHACEEHVVRWCDTCRSSVSNAHDHDDYVGQAEVTDRFLEADLTWNWRPMALDERGLPAFDDDGGMWMYVLIGGVERLAYGKPGAGGKPELISNGLKNAGIRFGTALNQWAQTDLHATTVNQTQGTDRAPADAAAPPAEPQYADPNWIARVGSLLARKRDAHGEDRPRVLSEILEREVAEVQQITPAEARRVVRILSGGPDLYPPAPAAAAEPDPTDVPPAAEPVPPPTEPAPTPARAAPAKRAAKPTAARPTPTPAPAPAPQPGMDIAQDRTINSLLSSRGVPENDTTARLGIISDGLKRTVRSMNEISHTDAQILIRGLGSGDFSVDPPPAAEAAAEDTQPPRSTYDDISDQIGLAVTDEDAQLVKVQIGEALLANRITSPEGGMLVDRLEERGRAVDTP